MRHDMTVNVQSTQQIVLIFIYAQLLCYLSHQAPKQCLLRIIIWLILQLSQIHQPLRHRSTSMQFFYQNIIAVTSLSSKKSLQHHHLSYPSLPSQKSYHLFQMVQIDQEYSPGQHPNDRTSEYQTIFSHDLRSRCWVFI